MLGYNDNFLSPNFGSSNGIIIKPEANCTYTELITQASFKESESEIFRFITDSWEKMPKELTYKRTDVNGFREEKPISLVTNRWGKNTVSDKAVNDVRIKKKINGSSVFEINIFPNSKVELIIIEK